MDETALPKLKKQTLVEDFINRFEDLIISGRLAIGQKLPSERDLAVKLGVSRPVVHEGLIDLASKGLVTRLPNGGAVVNDYRQDGSLTMLTSLLSYNKGDVDPQLAKSVTELRYLLESENARMAARNCTFEQVNELREVLKEEITVDNNDTQALAAQDFKFHHLISLATWNILYPLLINSFRTLYINGASLFYTNRANIPLVHDFHIQIVEAIARRDETLAVEVMHRMLEHGTSQYFAMVTQKQ
jgi:DNA-binding FadR family transcriptional regulator